MTAANNTVKPRVNQLWKHTGLGRKYKVISIEPRIDDDGITLESLDTGFVHTLPCQELYQKFLYAGESK